MKFEYFIRPDSSEREFEYKTLATSEPGFSLIVHDDTPPLHRMEYRDFPELIEVYDWCGETFGQAYGNWYPDFYIGNDKYARSVPGGKVYVKKCTVRIFMKDQALLALFKLRWT